MTTICWNFNRMPNWGLSVARLPDIGDGWNRWMFVVGPIGLDISITHETEDQYE